MQNSFINRFDNCDWATIDALAKADDLVSFVRKVLAEGIKQETNQYFTLLDFILLFLISVDLRNLIHAVEEHSDHFIREDTVSCLIDVQRFLAPMLLLDPSNIMLEVFCKQLKSDRKVAGKVLDSFLLFF